MEKGLIGTQVVTQIGILVNDIEKTCQKYAEFLGVENPGFKITNVYNEARTEFKGKPTAARAKLAFFQGRGKPVHRVDRTGPSASNLAGIAGYQRGRRPSHRFCD